MSKAKPSKPKKPAHKPDVAHPDTSAPSDTSKPIITQRPIIKDPMMVGKAAGPETEKEDTLPVKRSAKVAPLKDDKDEKSSDDDDRKQDESDTADDKPESSPEKHDTGKADTDETPADDDKTGDSGKKSKPAEDKAAAKARAEQEARSDKLVENKQYFLPINAAEHRRSARFAAVGIILALVLAAAWVDIALDAGLIHINGIEPVTHLFSN